MINRVCLMAVTSAALILSTVQVSFAETVTHDVTVDVTSGPLAGERYTGSTSIDESSLLVLGDNLLQPMSITFNFGEINFTEADDVRDIDANSPTVNVQDGTFVGITYIVSRFGDRPTEIPLVNSVLVDGFAINNREFGYVVGADFYGGVVNYALSPTTDALEDALEPEPPQVVPEPPPVSVVPESLPTQAVPTQAVPEPSLWLGLALVGYWLTRRWDRPAVANNH